MSEKLPYATQMLQETTELLRILRTQHADIERKDALLRQALEALHGVLDKYGEPINIMSISGGLYEVVQCNDAISAIKKEIAS